MNQRYHVVFEGENKVTTRRPWKGRGVELYSSSGDPARGIPAMFGSHEVRQFLENLGPFIVASMDNPAVAAQILDEGYVVTDPDSGAKSKWYVGGYFVRDDGAVYIMLPEVTTDAQFRSKLGLHIDLNDQWGNSFKVGKYLKRLFSHHRKFMQGEVVKELDNVVLVRLKSGKVISVKYADHGALTDGMNLVSTHCMKLMGLNKTMGAGLRITALSPKGFSKGHAIVLPELQHDVVLFNSKKLLTGDQFTFGMDWLHSGAVFTDMQSVINFRFANTSFLSQWDKEFLETVVDAIEDEDKLKRMLQFYHVEFHKQRDDDGDMQFIQKDKEWALFRALRGGVKIQDHPALVRKVFHLFADKVRNCETNIRVPIPETAGGARYALVDPTIFDMWGDPTLEGTLKNDQVYCAGDVGSVVFHRQPNAHRDEHYIARATSNEYLKAMDTGCFMFISKDIIKPSLAKLGGGDQDDRLVYYKDPAVVEHFRQLELDPYPTVPLVEKPEPPKRSNAFAHRLHRTPIYDRTQLLMMLDQMKNQSLHIGFVVNAGMHDTVLTDNRAEITRNLEALPKTLKNQSAYEWFTTKYQNYTLREPMSRLELVIDAVKKTGADLAGIRDQVKKFNDTFEVVAEFMTRGGRYDGRIPLSRRGDSHPVMVRTIVDDKLDELKRLRQDLEDIITDISWQMIPPVAEEILTCPCYEEQATQLAYAMRQEYRNQWANLSKEIERTGDKAEVKKTIDAYMKIDKAMYERFAPHPLIIDAMVKLYIMVYESRKPEAPRDEDGRPIKFGDGILWGPRMSGLTLRMMERAGLAGRFTEITFEDEVKHLRKESLDVVIDQGIVRQEGTNILVGTIDPMADGAKKAEKGWVKVAARDAYPYEPEPRYMILRVVNGMHAKGASPVEIAQWRDHANEQVELVPFIWTNPENEEEHAVRVVLNGQDYGYIDRKDNTYVTEKTMGWLLPGTTPKTMGVLVYER